jgi:hypothetical protein
MPSRYVPPLFPEEASGGNGIATAWLEQAFANDRTDMAMRVELALYRMKAGQTLEQARSFIDERAIDLRSDSRIDESNDWAIPAHQFFFAGELEAARYYYELVASFNTGSGSDLQARLRLRLMAPDIPGALKASRAMLRRYEGDFARRDVAGLEFMSNHEDAAWEVLRPRLPQSNEIDFWIGASVGQRIKGLTARQVRDWIVQGDYGHARAHGVDIATGYLSRFILDDRLPTDDDLALTAETGRQRGSTDGPQFAAVKLKQMAFAEHVDEASLREVREMISGLKMDRRGTLKPLYAWVTWQASGGRDPTLAALKSASVGGDLDSMLAKAILLGLDGNPSQATAYLRAARIELGEHSNGRLNGELRSPPYSVALTSYLLYSRTKDVVYRDEALTVAHAYERIFPFLAWPYALDALLSGDSPARHVVACRARFLDRNSLFLRLSGQAPDLKSAVCRQALW